MALSRDIGKLVYNRSNGRLVYRRITPNSGKLIYSRLSQEEEDDLIRQGYLVVTITWGSTGRDLDICGHVSNCTNDSDCVGWNWNTQATSRVPNTSSTFNSIWDSGDDTSVAGEERIFVKRTSSDTVARTYRIGLNYYGYGDEYTSNKCTVKVTFGTTTLTLNNATCGTTAGERAPKTGGHAVEFTIQGSGAPSNLHQA